MKRNLINGTYSLDSRDIRIFEAMISNLNAFLIDADKKSQKNPASIGVKKTEIIITMGREESELKDMTHTYSTHAIEFPEASCR